MESLWSLLLFLLFFFGLAGLFQRIFGSAGSVILLILTFGIFGGGDDC